MRSSAKVNYQATRPIEQPHMLLSSPNPQPSATPPLARRESVAFPDLGVAAPPLLQSQHDEYPETRWYRQPSDVQPQYHAPGSWELGGFPDSNFIRTTAGLAATPSAAFDPETFAQSVRRPSTKQYYEYYDQQTSNRS